MKLHSPSTPFNDSLHYLHQIARKPIKKTETGKKSNTHYTDEKYKLNFVKNGNFRLRDVEKMMSDYQRNYF